MPPPTLRVRSKQYERHCKAALIDGTDIARGPGRVIKTLLVTFLLGAIPLFWNIKMLFSNDLIGAIVGDNGPSNELQHKIPIFYNLYVGNKTDAPRVLDIIKEQLKGVQPALHGPIYMTLIGTQLEFLIQATASYIPNGTEMSTLHSLWEYCRRNPHQKVVYVHSKGSFHPTEDNEKLRSLITKAALSKQCASLPSECNVCSARFSPLPHAHTSGNMWLARCSYVQHLMDPLKFEDAMDQIYPNSTEPLPCRGQGRYAAEHWIHSHPKASPCDLYKRRTFVWGYDGLPPLSNKYNFDLSMAPRYPTLRYYLLNRLKNVCPDSLDTRFREYKRLYGQTPGMNVSSWWGWRVKEYDPRSRRNPS